MPLYKDYKMVLLGGIFFLVGIILLFTAIRKRSSKEILYKQELPDREKRLRIFYGIVLTLLGLNILLL